MPPTTALLEPMRAYFVSMAGGNGDRNRAECRSARPSQPHFTASGIDVYVDLAEHIDVEVEISRKEKEIAESAQMIAGKEKQLSNEAFVSRAPKAVIEKEQAALEELREEKIGGSDTANASGSKTTAEARRRGAGGMIGRE